MDELENLVQKNVVNFCKILPVHVEKWTTILDAVTKPGQALSNYAEQLRHIEKADIKYLDNFSDLQDKLRYKLHTEIEDEINTLKDLINQLNQLNHALKNKLSQLERSSVHLDWERKSKLIKGTAVQPPLTRILQAGFVFWLYFSNAAKQINDSFKMMVIRDEKSVKKFHESFAVNLKHHDINNLLAVVQYMNNDNILI